MNDFDNEVYDPLAYYNPLAEYITDSDIEEIKQVVEDRKHTIHELLDIFNKKELDIEDKKIPLDNYYDLNKENLANVDMYHITKDKYASESIRNMLIITDMLYSGDKYFEFDVFHLPQFENLGEIYKSNPERYNKYVFFKKLFKVYPEINKFFNIEERNVHLLNLPINDIIKKINDGVVNFDMLNDICRHHKNITKDFIDKLTNHEFKQRYKFFVSLLSNKHFNLKLLRNTCYQPFDSKQIIKVGDRFYNYLNENRNISYITLLKNETLHEIVTDSNTLKAICEILRTVKKFKRRTTDEQDRSFIAYVRNEMFPPWFVACKKAKNLKLTGREMSEWIRKYLGDDFKIIDMFPEVFLKFIKYAKTYVKKSYHMYVQKHITLTFDIISKILSNEHMFNGLRLWYKNPSWNDELMEYALKFKWIPHWFLNTNLSNQFVKNKLMSCKIPTMDRTKVLARKNMDISFLIDYAISNRITNYTNLYYNVNITPDIVKKHIVSNTPKYKYRVRRRYYDTLPTRNKLYANKLIFDKSYRRPMIVSVEI